MFLNILLNIKILFNKNIFNHSLKSYDYTYLWKNFYWFWNITSLDKSINWFVRILKVSKVRNYKEELVNSDQDWRIVKD